MSPAAQRSSRPRRLSARAPATRRRRGRRRRRAAWQLLRGAIGSGTLARRASRPGARSTVESLRWIPNGRSGRSFEMWRSGDQERAAAILSPLRRARLRSRAASCCTVAAKAIALTAMACGPAPSGSTGTETGMTGASTTASAGATLDSTEDGGTGTSSSGSATADPSSATTDQETDDPTTSGDVHTCVEIETEGSAATCPPHRFSHCTCAFDCSLYDQYCGAPDSPFDADGCMRPLCADSRDCPPGSECLPWNSGAVNFSCSDIHQTCSCGGDPISGDFTLSLCFP